MCLIQNDSNKRTLVRSSLFMQPHAHAHKLIRVHINTPTNAPTNAPTFTQTYSNAYIFKNTYIHSRVYCHTERKRCILIKNLKLSFFFTQSSTTFYSASDGLIIFFKIQSTVNII